MFDYSATGTFATRYNGSRQEITQNYNGAFHLADSTRGAVIHTWNLNGSTSLANRSELSDNNNLWTAAEHASSENDMALDVHWALQKIYDHLNDSYGYDSFNDNGFAIDANIHYGTGTQKDNAGWIPALDVLIFGDGYVDFRPVASLDAVAHEYGHGITDFQIGWGLTGDPRAFSEGLSDIWGAIMEYRINPGSVWKIGEQIDLDYDCLRNIQSTNNTYARMKIADTYSSTQYNEDEEDFYVRSGVFSHWFYLLVNGGTGTNGVGNSYNVTGIGIDEAEDLIVEAVFNNYLDNLTTYSAIRTAMVNAARSLCSNQNGALVNQVESAWHAVGVGTQPTIATISGPTLICSSPNSTFVLSGRPAGTTVAWTKSANLDYVSGQGTNSYIVNASASSGAGWVKATITYSCDVLTLPSYAVWVGTPIISITGPDYGCTNTSHTFHAQPTNSLSAPSSYSSWGIDPNDGYISTNWNGEYAYITFYNEYSAAGYDVEAKGTNTCGTGSFGYANIWIYDCYYYVISPNPASDVATITRVLASEDTNGKTIIKKFDGENATCDIQIIDYYGSVHLQTTKSGDSFTIPVSNLKNGNYFVKITDGKKTSSALS
jgi:bacillolysin